MNNIMYVLFANITNYLLHEKLDDLHMQRIISSIQRQMTATAEIYNGAVVKSEGEDFMCHFSDINDAVRGAAAIMRSVESGNFPEAWRFSIRMGVCDSAEILLFENWAQLANLARPHQILVTAGIAKTIPEPAPFKFSELPSVRIDAQSPPVWKFRWKESETGNSAPQSTATDAAPVNSPAVIIQHLGAKWLIQREGDAISIGRDKSNNIVINENIVSRHHVHIMLSNGKVVLSDQSTNGTYIFPSGGKPILLVRDKTVLSGNGKISFEYFDAGLAEIGLEYLVLLG